MFLSKAKKVPDNSSTFKKFFYESVEKWKNDNIRMKTADSSEPYDLYGEREM